MDSHALRVLEFDAVRRQLADHASCALGQERAEALEPAGSLSEAQSRLNETSECRRLIQIKGNLPLGGISDIRPLIRQAEIGATLDPHALLSISSFAQASKSLKGFLQKIAPDYPIMAGIAGALGQFPALESDIAASLSPAGLVLDSASPDLARIRSRRKIASQKMLDKLNGIISGPSRTLLQDPVIVQRGDRYCVPVKAEHRGALGGIVHDTSASGATLFIEPQAVVDLGNEIKELVIKEDQEIARILARLTAGVRRVSTGLLTSAAVTAEIDFISARAKLAETHRGVEPALNQSGRTRLRAARHPLIDPERVVAIDVELGSPENALLLITGPNTGGKTVTLKTVGLLALMAQCGLHLPASDAEVNIFDDVFADIGDEQSLQQSLSTFSGHISNIVHILKELRTNSLVLLDEVGAGTDPAEGAALARAVLDALHSVKGVRVVATTHYGELKTYAFSTPGVQNSSVEFDEATLAPTFRLLQGVPGSSNAFAIAGRLGMPSEILAAARRMLTGSDETADILHELEEWRRKAIADARAAEKARIEVQMLRRRYEEQLANLDELRREARQRAADEARTLIKRAQEKAENIIADLRSMQEEGKRTERARAKIQEIGQELQHAIRAQLADEPVEEEPESEMDRPLVRGGRVRIASLGMVGELLEEPGDGPNAQVAVQVGSMRVSVPVVGLRAISDMAGRKPDRPADQPPQTEDTDLRLQKAIGISSELTLLGQRADEALQNVERYIEDAYAAGLTRARLVHGKGTGALRRAVQGYLHDHPLVTGYEPAGPGEGGAGATVVLLKES